MKFWSLFVLILMLLTSCRPSAPLPTAAYLPTSYPQPTRSTPVSLTQPLPTKTYTSQPFITATFFLSVSDTPTQVISPTATITDTPTITPTPLPLEIDFERVYPIDLPLRAPLMAALSEDRSVMIDNRYTLTAYKTRDGWVKMLLVPTLLIEQNWQNVEILRDQFVEVVGWKENDLWQMTRIDSLAFDSIRDRIPDGLMARTKAIPPLAGEYLFPWAKGQAWWAIQGWHDGYALDFQPVTGQRNNVLASESGWLREICGDGYQSFLEIQHSDGRSTFYLHVDMPRRIRGLLDHPVQRGQYLGELISEAYFATDCGRGLSRHLHFVVSDPMMTIDGYVLSEIASVASCCAAPPMYVSSNVKVDEE